MVGRRWFPFWMVSGRCELLVSGQNRPLHSGRGETTPFPWFATLTTSMINNRSGVLGLCIYIYNLYIRILCPVTINCLKSAWFEMIQNLLGHKIPFRLSQSCCNPPKAWDLCNMMVLTQRFFFVDFLHGKPKRRWEASDSNRPRSQKYEAQKRWG